MALRISRNPAFSIRGMAKGRLIGPDAECAGCIRQPRPGLPWMADGLRSILQNLEQPFDPVDILCGEAALEVGVVGEDQGCKRGDVSRCKRGAVADRVAVWRLAGNDRNTGRAKVEFGPAAGKRRYKQPARRGSGGCGLRRLRTVFREASHSVRPHRPLRHAENRPETVCPLRSCRRQR